MKSAATTGLDYAAAANSYLQSHDSDGLKAYLGQHVPRPALVGMLTDPNADLVKASVTSLAACGTMSDTPALARLLHHSDEAVATLAENALWSIWLRAGGPEANTLLIEAIEAMNENAYTQAVRRLDDAIRRCPDFAEAYNQRAIAWYLSGKYLRSVADCRRTLALNPYHFGAAAGLGHAYAELGMFERSLDAYHAAIKLHPRMDGVRVAMEKVREILTGSSRPRRLRD